MSKKISFIIELYDKVTAPLRKTESAFNKVTKSVSKTQSKLQILPSSIQKLENELSDLKRKQANAFSVQAIRYYQKEIEKTEKELKKLNRIKQGGGIKGGLKSFGTELSSQIPALGGSMAMLTSPAGLAAGAVVGIGVALKNVTSKAMDFEKGMAKVNGTLQLSPDKLKNVRSELISLGAKSSTALNKIPDAFYKIVSATGGDLPTGMKILKASLKGAEAGFTDVNQVADATVNIVNAVGKANTNATEVMDVLFATLNKGKTEFPEIANYLPKLIPISNNLGTSFKETAGAFAFLTANGLKAEASTTALQNVFKSFGVEKTRKNFEALGIKIFDANGKMRNLTSISIELNKALSGLTDEQRVKKLESLGLDQEAALGMSIMSANAKDLKNTIDYVAKSGGELNRTLAKSGNPLTKLNKLGNMFQAGMIKLGYAILPVVNNVLEKVLNWSQKISEGFSLALNKSELLRDVVYSIGYVAKSSFMMMWNGVVAIGKVFTWLGDKLGITKGDILGLLKGINDFYVTTKNKISAIGSGFLAVFKMIKKAWDAIWSGDFNILKKLKISDLSKAFNKAYDKQIVASGYKKIKIEEITEKIKDKVKYKKIPLVFDNTKKDTKKQEQDKTQTIANSITAGGKKQTNININLKHLLNDVNIYAQKIDEGTNQMADIILQELNRVLRAANSSIG